MSSHPWSFTRLQIVQFDVYERGSVPKVSGGEQTRGACRLWVMLRVFVGYHASRGSGKGNQVIGEIVSGVLVDLIALTSRRLGTAAAALRGRRRRRDLDLARWLDTYQIVEPPPDICALPAGPDWA